MACAKNQLAAKRKKPAAVATGFDGIPALVFPK
jgi:hypothetical protein